MCHCSFPPRVESAIDLKSSFGYNYVTCVCSPDCEFLEFFSEENQITIWVFSDAVPVTAEKFLKLAKAKHVFELAIGMVRKELSMIDLNMKSINQED